MNPRPCAVIVQYFAMTEHRSERFSVRAYNHTWRVYPLRCLAPVGEQVRAAVEEYARTVLGCRAPVIGERVRLDLHQDVVIVEDSEPVSGR
jgi:hypothetical protein